MAKIRTLQIYRGTTAQNDAYTGSAGELTMDTTTNELRLHDGSTAGGHVIGSGGSGSYHPDLFDVKWADHICNDVQWLRADTFSWQSGAVYQVAYQHLADDIDGKTLQSETVAGTTIQFYLADDGHKICPASEESNVTAIYNATGVAWYYIIDTANTRFKLPRTQFAFTGIRNGVGNFVEAGLPNITGSVNLTGQSNTTTPRFNSNDVASSALYNNVSIASGMYHTDSASGSGYNRIEIDASRSNSIYGNSTSVQPKATEMYLYFYVGNFTQTALENTAGLNASLFNGKADLDFANTDMIDYVIEKQDPTAENNYIWYRKYKSGWVEQGGRAGTGTTNPNPRNVVFPVEMADTNYHILGSVLNATDNAATFTMQPRTISTTGMTVYCTYSKRNESGGSGETYCWQVSGMAA